MIEFRDIDALSPIENLSAEDVLVVALYGDSTTNKLRKISVGSLSENLPGTIEGLTASAEELNKLDGAGAVVASGTQHAHVADAVTSHSLNATFDNSEVEGALDALGTKINAIFDALEAFRINATS